MSRKRWRALVRVLGAVAAVLLVTWLVVAQPTFQHNIPSRAIVDAKALRGHVDLLAHTWWPRNWQRADHLDQAADYIAGQFKSAGAVVEGQAFTVGDRSYRNVIGRFAAGRGRRVVVGAHYDSCGDTPGADDNASGVAVLLELARMLGQQAPTSEVELVAYALEEPPFFRTAQMGSAVHAKRLADEHADIRGVIVLEMVGYFDDAWGSQSYPLPLLYAMYPNRANFIGVIGPAGQGAWVKAIKIGMQGTSDLPVYSIRAPSIVPGVDFSDHMNYWPYGFQALMITDTAFYRNKAYHEVGDTAERLDYARMAKVAVAVFEAIR